MIQEFDKAPTSPSSPPPSAGPPKSSERFLTKKQFAALLQVTERTIDRWLLEGTLPSESKFAIGGSVRFRPVVLEEWIRSRQCDRA
jgi:excisionase family DNA binding protein